ncbi:hypothetical protein E1A91_D10G231900v1 [Gossypium mustelinum]|uniref:Uncharacterized protein n=1 Tax=Gossypium mustelinum TaxID=34275 RepID=A0A5D2TBY4_GOSMU|nr:hypothetical protein E1A91_D10G231900v1 [Gossypium mustelinum]
MTIPVVLDILFPPTLLLTGASVLTLLSLAILGVLEIRGINMKYSKFVNAAASSSSSSISFIVPSRVGMLLLYTPAFLVGVASFWLYPADDSRFLFLKSAVTIHFFKRLFEVIFIHKYSGEMSLDTIIIILVSYFFVSLSLIYTQTFNQGL